jgi:hypothetical protein
LLLKTTAGYQGYLQHLGVISKWASEMFAILITALRYQERQRKFNRRFNYPPWAIASMKQNNDTPSPLNLYSHIAYLYHDLGYAVLHEEGVSDNYNLEMIQSTVLMAQQSIFGFIRDRNCICRR